VETELSPIRRARHFQEGVMTTITQQDAPAPLPPHRYACKKIVSAARTVNYAGVDFSVNVLPVAEDDEIWVWPAPDGLLCIQELEKPGSAILVAPKGRAS
jgi:hypothetical protein